jgi:hypothetical protein
MSGPGYAPPPQGGPQFQAPGALGYPAPVPGYHQAGPAGPPGPGPLPPSLGVPVPAGPPPWAPPQRPAVIALACTLAVMGSLQWVCGLSLLWVTASVGAGAFAEVNDNGAVFHLLNRFNYRMLDGLAVPLYLFPLASLVTGFLILSRRPWTRVVHSAVGLVALAWAAWWLQDNLLWWFSAAWYVVVACLVLWTPSATAWYGWRQDERQRYPLG